MKVAVVVVDGVGLDGVGLDGGANGLVWIVVSKAFQVLSDPQQRESFDRFGGDPAARGGGGGGGGGGDPFSGFRSAGGGGAGGFAGGPELSPEDLFNMFFGTVPGAGPFGGGFVGGGVPFGGGGFGGRSPFSDFVSFGGPGIRVQQFGGPGVRRRRPAPAEEAEREDQPQQEASFRTTFIQLLPLIVLFIFPILSGLFSELGSGSGKPQFPDMRFEKIHPFTEQRFTPKHHIPYWVSPRELKEFGMQPGAKGADRKFKEMDKRAEVRYVGWLQVECSREMRVQQREIEDAMGWLWADAAKVKAASNKILPACQSLRDMGEGRVMG